MTNEQRRRVLKIIAAGGLASLVGRAIAKGDLPPGVQQIEGTALVNGKPAHVGTPVNVGDRVSTGRASQAVIVIGGDAMLMRAQTTVEVKGRDGVLSEMLVATGRVLTVFSKKPVSIKAGNASIGIRGTGAYIEIDPDAVYFCLCYGEALVEGAGMAGQVVKTTHHEQPLLLRTVGGVVRPEPGPFRDHTDAELEMLEALVGRVPPFKKGGTYPAAKY
jgi:FecR protein